MKALIVGVAILAAAGAACAAPPDNAGQNGGTVNAQPGTNGPQPNRQAERGQGQGLFPPNQPVPPYGTTSNGVGASLYHPGSGEPNAGATGFSGSSGNNLGGGWAGPPYANSQSYANPNKQP